MYLLLDVISTEDFVNRDFLVSRGTTTGYKFWNGENGEAVVGFNQFKRIISVVERAFLEKETYYKRNGKKLYLYAYVVDLDTQKVKMFTMRELILFLKSNSVIGITKGENLYLGTLWNLQQFNVSYSSNNKVRDSFLGKTIEFQLFGTKNALLENPFYLVQLLAVNHTMDFKFNLENIVPKDRPKKIEELLNSTFSLGFYVKETCEQLCIIDTSYLHAYYLYFQLEGANHIYQLGKQPIMCYLNHAFEFNVKGKRVFLARQEKQADCKKLTEMTKGCANIVKSFCCDNKNIEQWDIPALVELY